jgi:hypothetical protein
LIWQTLSIAGARRQRSPYSFAEGNDSTSVAAKQAKYRSAWRIGSRLRAF